MEKVLTEVKKADRLKKNLLKTKKIKRNNPMAKLLSLPNFQQRKVKSKKLYNRQQAKSTLMDWEDGGQ
tara:strand:- start:1068 stop:1271 length:204 start_codon:yes stop_codon:yes gene_type:complete